MHDQTETNDLVAIYKFHSKSSDSIRETDLRITSIVEIKSSPKWIGHRKSEKWSPKFITMQVSNSEKK